MTTEPADRASTTGHRALYRRFRAQTFAEIVGQTATVTTLRNAVRLGRLGHGFLFVGPRGTGKTSMARILAKAVNCDAPVDGEPCDRCPPCGAIREGRALDVIELDAASNNRVDDMRELLPRVYTAAADLRRKVFIIDEVQRIKEGWDVLLKTLEEPPDGVLFIFCTTDPGQIRPAVVSRLQRFTFRPLTRDEIAGKLGRILAAEDRSADPAAIDAIARLAAGGMRDAESLLDQVLATSAGTIDAAIVGDLLGLADATLVDAFADALVRGAALEGIAILDRLEVDGRDAAAFADQVIARLRELLVAALRSGAPSEDLARAARRIGTIDGGRGGPGGIRWQLELALLDAAASPTAAAPSPTTRSAAAPAPSGTGAVRTPSPASAPPPGPPSAPPPAPAVPAPASAPPPAPLATSPAPAAERIPASPGPESHEADPARLHAPAPPAPPAPAAPPSGPEPAAIAASPPPTPAPAPDGGPAGPLARVASRWPEIVAHVGRNPANRPIITACRPVEIRDGMLVLGFPEQQAFLRDHAERRKAAIEEGIAAVLGRPLGVRCVVANLELPETGIEGDDLVAAARRVFDGELIDADEIG